MKAEIIEQLTLQNISKELRIPSEIIVSFLNDKGTTIENLPYEKVTAEDYILLKQEVKSLPANTPLIFISDEEIKNFKPVTKPIEFWADSPLSNLEKLIYRQLSFEKPKTERVVGITPFNWHFCKAKLQGKFSTGQRFTLFDDTVTELLSIKPNQTLLDLADLMGFGTDLNIVNEIIIDLKLNGIITGVGIPEQYSLTEKGKTDHQYRTKSKPPTTYQFELFIDYYNPANRFAKSLFNREAKISSNELKPAFDFSDIEKIKSLAEEQASNIHLPKAGFFLQEANLIENSLEYFQLRYIAVITEILDTNSNNIWIFDPYKKDISRPLTQIARASDELQKSIKDSFLTEAKASGELLESVQKDVEQIEFDKAIVSSLNIDDTQTSVPESFKPFLSYDSLNTVEFELEMEKLFDTVKNQLWLIFPWVKDGAFAQRLALIRKAIRNKTIIFIAFSENEGMVRKPNDKMVGERAMGILEQLSIDHTNFFFAELSKFHEKRVFAFLDDKFKCEYSGSQNYLSFYVDKSEKGFRRENMKRVVWSEKSDEEFELRKDEFINSYLKRIYEQLQRDEAQLTVATFKFEALVKVKKRMFYDRTKDKVESLKKNFGNDDADIEKSLTDIQTRITNVLQKIK